VIRRDQSLGRILLPEIDAAEATLVEGLEVIAVGSLTALVNHLSGVLPIAPAPHRKPGRTANPDGVDFTAVYGQENVKRALEVWA